MENFDAIRWLIRNDMTLGFKRVTLMSLRMIQKTNNTWLAYNIDEMLPETAYVVSDGCVANKGEFLKDVIDRKINCLDVKCGVAHKKDCAIVPGVENLYLMQTAPYSLLVDKKTGFFKAYDYYVDGLFGGDKRQLARHFQKKQHEHMGNRFAGAALLPSDTWRGTVADVLKFAIETSEKKPWSAKEINEYIQGQMNSRQR